MLILIYNQILNHKILYKLLNSFKLKHKQKKNQNLFQEKIIHIHPLSLIEEHHIKLNHSLLVYNNIKPINGHNKNKNWDFIINKNIINGKHLWKVKKITQPPHFQFTWTTHHIKGGIPVFINSLITINQFIFKTNQENNKIILLILCHKIKSNHDCSINIKIQFKTSKLIHTKNQLVKINLKTQPRK